MGIANGHPREQFKLIQRPWSLIKIPFSLGEILIEAILLIELFVEELKNLRRS